MTSPAFIDAVPLIRNEAARAEISVQSLRGNVHVLMGSGGNIAVLSGRDGKLVVDAGIAVSRARIANALAALGPAPVTHLVNTHWHFDHTDGNEWLHAAGASIIAHENTRRRLSTATRVEGWNFTFPPAPAGALPTTVFGADYALRANGRTIALEYYWPAHTDSDISVTFGDAEIVHVGDTWWNGIYPFIDYSTGGSIDGTIRAAEANVADTTDATIVIPGHGPIGNRSGLIEFRDMLVAIRDKVSALKTQGMSLDEVIAARPTAAHDGKWGNFVVTPSFFTRLVYDGV